MVRTSSNGSMVVISFRDRRRGLRLGPFPFSALISLGAMIFRNTNNGGQPRLPSVAVMMLALCCRSSADDDCVDKLEEIRQSYVIEPGNDGHANHEQRAVVVQHQAFLELDHFERITLVVIEGGGIGDTGSIV